VLLAPGFEISRIVTGLWQVADMERAGSLVDADVAAAAEDLRERAASGFTTLDMADHYGSAEDIAGLVPAAERLTKWVPPPGSVTKDIARTAVQRSLRRLRAERIDLLQFHAWRWSHPGWLDALFALDDLRREGLIAHLGVTNFDAAHLKMALDSGISLVSNQVSFSLLDRRALGALSQVCRDTPVRLLAYGTLLGGFLSDAWLGAPDPGLANLKTWSQMKYYRFIQEAGGWRALQALLTALRGVADRAGDETPITSVAHRAILDEPSVAAVIVGHRPGRARSDAGRLESMARVSSLPLNDADRAAITEAVSHLRAIPGENGDEYRRPPFLTASGDLSHHVETTPDPYPVVADDRGRVRASSGTIWESVAGFSRAVRDGSRILVSGTTATHGARIIGGRDPASQTRFILDKIEGSIESLGGRIEDVVRTRVFVNDIRHWEAVTRAHGERFGSIRPANTLVQAGLIGDGYLVEIEAEAIVRS
jgi:aryl-alcohol dehydrogenase-like predicted oxidoreductase/enamine deaminase RidA (YjgF/YER057c/UK114 family)